MPIVVEARYDSFVTSVYALQFLDERTVFFRFE
jgi:hypothetical protein